MLNTCRAVLAVLAFSGCTTPMSVDSQMPAVEFEAMITPAPTVEPPAPCELAALIDTTEDGKIDAVDMTCDGKVDARLNRAVTCLVDTNGNAILDSVDLGCDGTPEKRFRPCAEIGDAGPLPPGGDVPPVLLPEGELPKETADAGVPAAPVCLDYVSGRECDPAPLYFDQDGIADAIENDCDLLPDLDAAPIAIQ